MPLACLRHPRRGTLAHSENGSVMGLERTVQRWSDLPLEKVTEMVSRKIIAGRRQMLVQVYLKRGAQVPVHAHESEQMVYVLQGVLRYRVDGREIVVRAGEVLHILSGVPHQAEAVDDTFELVVFAPRREEWLAADSSPDDTQRRRTPPT